MSRVELAKIRSLTFYKDELTAARRTSAIPQLKCVGRPCRLYQPDVIRCVNTGGDGVDIDWRCEADLPEALRFGKVEVSCEGWSRPGDPYVLKGSCALEYKLVQVPDALRGGKTDSPILGSWKEWDTSEIIFWVVWISILLFIVYNFLKSCFGNDRQVARTAGNNRPGPSPGGGWGRWFPRDDHDDYRPPPPPYSKDPPGTSTWDNWRPGFWTGAALGGLANQWWNNRNRRVYEPEPEPILRPGWFGSRQQSTGWSPFASHSQPSFRRARPVYDDSDRGEGPSNLGAMRSSTGIGGTNVR